MSKSITKELLDTQKEYLRMVFYLKEKPIAYLKPKEVFEPLMFVQKWDNFEELSIELSKSYSILLYLEQLLKKGINGWITKPIRTEELDGVFDNMFEIIVKKNKDYGSDNIQNIGLVGIYFMLSNKLNRISSLLEKDKPNFESIEDSYFDIASYALLGLLLCNDVLLED